MTSSKQEDLSTTLPCLAGKALSKLRNYLIISTFGSAKPLPKASFNVDNCLLVMVREVD